MECGRNLYYYTSSSACYPQQRQSTTTTTRTTRLLSTIIMQVPCSIPTIELISSANRRRSRRRRCWPAASFCCCTQRQRQKMMMIRLPEKNVKSITSTGNPFVKHCVKLRQSSSYRQSHGSALVVGTIPIREICKFNSLDHDRSSMMDCLFLLDGADVPEGLHDCPAHIVHVSSMVMKRLSGLQSTESVGAVAVMRIPSSFVNLDNMLPETDVTGWFPSPHRILVLDGIQDPGNLGTLLRSAMAFRWGGVFLLPGCCDPFNEKAIRASRGASFQLPIVCGSWTHLNVLRNEFGAKMLAGHPDSGDTSKRISLLSQGLADSLAGEHLFILLGSEGVGLSEKSFEVCELVSIPMDEGFESLNVAVAGGIFLFMLQPQE